MNQDTSCNMNKKEKRKAGLTWPITHCVARAARGGCVFAATNSQDALRRIELLAPPCPPSGCRGTHPSSPPKWDFPNSSDSKESTCSAGELGSIPGSGRSPGGGNGHLLQYFCLEYPMDRGDIFPYLPAVGAEGAGWPH